MITAPPNKIVVAVDLQQRSNYMMKYGTLELWMDSSFGEDGKHTNPSLCEVVAVGDGVDNIHEGMYALCHYNTFAARVTNNYLFGSHEQKDKDGRDYFTILPERVRCYLDKEGKPVPMEGYILVKRLSTKVHSTLVIPDVAQQHDMMWFEVVKVGEVTPFKEGDLVLCYKYSDIEMKYTINKTPVECFVVKMDDVSGYVKRGDAVKISNIKLV